MRPGLSAAFVLILFMTGCGASSQPTSSRSSASAIPTETAPSPTAALEPTLSGTFMAGDHEVWIECIGSGAPTFIVQSGEGMVAGDMAVLRAILAQRGTSCVYDPGNVGRSGSVPTPKSAEQAAGELNALLQAADVPGPYVLVGHSAGGMLVQLYPRLFPDQVIGVVALNPVPPYEPWVAEAGPIMSETEREAEQGYYAGLNGEDLDYRTSSAQIEAATPAPSIPFEMLISTNAQCESAGDICERTYPAYERIMRQVAESWPDGNFSQADAQHEIYLDDPDAILEVVDALLERAAAYSRGMPR